jgi:hypothetical protein
MAGHEIYAVKGSDPSRRVFWASFRWQMPSMERAKAPNRRTVSAGRIKYASERRGAPIAESGGCCNRSGCSAHHGQVGAKTDARRDRTRRGSPVSAVTRSRAGILMHSDGVSGDDPGRLPGTGSQVDDRRLLLLFSMFIPWLVVRSERRRAQRSGFLRR